jgi:hypothetical protein
VAARAIVVACVVARANLELQQTGAGVADAFDRVRKIIEREDIRDEVEPSERRVLLAPLGWLGEQDRIDATWRAEASAVLAWGLRRFELPAFDEQVDPFEVVTSLGMAGGDIDEDLLNTPSLRPADEIHALAEHLYTAHWRLVQYRLDGQSMDFDEFAETACSVRC